MALPGSAKYMIICMNGNNRRSSFHLESWNIFNIYLGFKYILYSGEAFCLQPKPEEFQRLIVISANPLWHLEIAFDKFPCTHQGLDSTPGILPLQNTNTRRIFLLRMNHSKRLGDLLKISKWCQYQQHFSQIRGLQRSDDLKKLTFYIYFCNISIIKCGHFRLFSTYRF